MSMRLGMSIGLAMLLFCGCTPQQSQVAQRQLPQSQGCDQTWFEKVEKQILTGDGSGHGPDLGSMEWRSVVEFKLGVRGDESLPEVNSDQWCSYIDQHFIK
ncbi:MAG: hypothetical protein ACI8SJ_000021 [Shewanella sp.]|jgi:hypothetical protein